MAAWKTPEHLEDHYRIHGHEFGSATVQQYDASAQETLDVGTHFEYTDDRTQEPRIGCFHRESGRFVSLDLDDRIVTHFYCPEWYIKRLQDNNYDG